MTAFEGSDVSLRVEGGIGTISLERPDRLNALSFETVDELHRVFDLLDRAPDVHVVVFTGAGRAFCAGIDLNNGLDMWPEPAERAHGRYFTQEHFARLVLRLRTIPQPVIAAVHGPACGGGFSLLAACDVRIADETAKANAAFVRVGLTGGDMGLSWFLPRLVGISAASELMYTGRFVHAEEALRIGLVSRVTAKGEDLAAARELAGQMLENTPFGLRMTKQAINQSLSASSLEAAIQMENRSQVLCSLTEEFNQAASRFIEGGSSASRQPEEKDQR